MNGANESKMTDRLAVFGFVLCLFIYNVTGTDVVESDDNGYVVYCPCMGRFGNQADHFLGSLGFAHELNRTLILPPWVEYRQYSAKSIQVPFDTYFKVKPLLKYNRVITMERFMKELAPVLWPPENRTVFCYGPRGDADHCNAKEGNPFGPFWDSFNVDFVRSEFFAPLHFDVHRYGMAERWNEKFPPDRYPVLAFVGAPASFPVQLRHRDLHEYLEWSDDIDYKSSKFIHTILPKGAFIGIHLRNGVDWVRACELTDKGSNFFAAAQCLGYDNENGLVTKELCLPSTKTILRQLKQAVRKEKAVAVFVASDDNHMINEINKGLKKLKVTAYRTDPSDPHLDLAILGKSNHLIANCVSSFSAFAVRERLVHGLPFSFWAHSVDGSTSTKRDEL